ncbi:uncharacterized protein isoform X2 [Choristoneura fumiferana]|uniref:uncharacterized protein isoform X2 n=1 Tax=Choristoneura fumiferana TaxID=7141 RepID=UPI003D157A37
MVRYELRFKGKVPTRIRADSINNLRKRYDAFLEEDRKRKERNEDILTKLDKMRNSVTRFKSNFYLDPRLPTNIYGDAQKSPVRRYNEPQISTELDIRTKHVDETRLLSQISKKYILIPKLRSIDVNDYVPRAIQQDNNNDNDWKSKYSILDQLKQIEKEEKTNSSAFNDSKFKNYHNLSTGLPKYQENDEPVKLFVKSDFEGMTKESLVHEFTPIQQSHVQNNMAATFNDFAVDSVKNIHVESEKQPKSQEPDIKRGEMESTKINDYVDNNFRGSVEENYQQQPKGEASFVVSEAPVQNYQAADAHEHVEYTAGQQNHSGETADKHETENTEKSYLGEEQISHVVAFHPEQSYPGNKDTSQAAALHPEKAYPGDDDITHVEVLHPDELVQEIANENIGGGQENDYPIDIINVQEFTPGNNVNLVDGVNINPEGHNVEQYIPPNHEYVPETITAADQEKDVTYQDPVYTDEQVTNEGNYDPSQQYESTGNVDNMDIASGIQEFETEQNEMYYSESNAQNYDQYNQGDVVDVYNTGYTGPMEGYDPSAYYEGTQQEGAYPVEINEHEETSQRYDPNYEQQYATTDADQNQYLPQQNAMEQPQSQQENLDALETAGDAKTPEYDREQYDTEQQEIAEHLEQQLDMEDGYVDQNLAGNIRDITDESILYQQATPDQTLEQNLENLTIPAVET